MQTELNKLLRVERPDVCSSDTLFLPLFTVCFFPPEILAINFCDPSRPLCVVMCANSLAKKKEEEKRGDIENEEP